MDKDRDGGDTLFDDEDLPSELKSLVKMAHKLVMPVRKDDFNWAAAAVIGEINLDERDRGEANLPNQKTVKGAAKVMAAAIKRLLHAEKQLLNFHHPMYYSAGIDYLPSEELYRILGQAEQVAYSPSPPPKRNADKKRKAADAAHWLAFEFAGAGWRAQDEAKLAAILFGDPDAELTRYVAEVRKRFAKPGQK